MTTKVSNRISDVFSKKRADEKIMSLFLTAGYPEIDSTAKLILGFEKNGADLIELGMPFSDPLADGPTIQHSSEVAIRNGICMSRIFEIVKEVRLRSEIPIILMGYINPLLRYGVSNFCSEASAAGVDGLIIPDLPVEESGILLKDAQRAGLKLIYLVAPNTRDDRMQMIDKKSEGFVYCVSVTGVTGARQGDEVAKSVSKFIGRVKKNIKKNPKLVGFGIKNHEDAKVIAGEVDGFIVGSALIDKIRESYPGKGWEKSLFSFVNDLKFGNIRR